MPIRSPRKVYLIKGTTVNQDDAFNTIDNLPGGTDPKTTRPMYCKMKQSIGNYFGMTPLAADDLAFQGTFLPGGLNEGYKYFKNIGGFRVASYKLIAKSSFAITEKVYLKNTKTYADVVTNFVSMSIGFPTGHTVNEIISWLKGLTANTDKIQAIVTPAGRRIEF